MGSILSKLSILDKIDHCIQQLEHGDVRSSFLVGVCSCEPNDHKASPFSHGPKSHRHIGLPLMKILSSSGNIDTELRQNSQEPAWDFCFGASYIGECRDDERCLGRDRAESLVDSRGEFGRPVGIFRWTDLGHGVFCREYRPILRGVQEGDSHHNGGVHKDSIPFKLGRDNTSRIDLFRDSG
ncbi:hypothetical protein TorRG33x02_135210, partial [Trema orientale]